VVFILIDEIERTSEALSKEEDIPTEDSIRDTFGSKPMKPEFRQGIEPYLASLSYANSLKGCVKFYGREDRNLVRDGDVLVYMGHNAKSICETFRDGFDVEVWKAKDLRKKMGI
jgi:hypothetical protein